MIQQRTMERARRVVERTAFAAAARLRPMRSSKPLWVFGAAAGREYCDNSRALYEHVLAHRPDIEAVWQIDRGSMDAADLPAGAQWVDRRSWSAYRLTRAADVVVFSHGVQDVAGLYGNRRGTIVRLGHGLTAFGLTRGVTPVSVRRMVRRVALAPVASEFERGHKRAWGFSEAQLPITGLARWDPLRAAAAAGRPRDFVLFAPTWRTWLTDEGFEQSHYWQHVQAVLEDQVIRAHLRERGLSLAVFAHPAIRSMLGARLSTAPVEIVPDGAALPEALARSALFLTDFSSIAFDALAIRVPTIFFHFDVERYVAERGSYVDLTSRLFGPTAHSIKDLRDHLKRLPPPGLGFQDFERDVEQWASRVFAYEDTENCRRVVAAIEAVAPSGETSGRALR